jgi:ribosomal protein L7/L12
MNDLELRNITSLQARMNRMESMMQQLLTIMTTSLADVERTMQMQNMLQDLHLSTDIYMASVNPIAVMPQERPEMEAIREALLSGDRIKAIQLYRSVYGVSFKAAQDALGLTPRH